MPATSAAQPARPPHTPARVHASCDVSKIPIVAATVCLAVTQQTALLPGTKKLGPEVNCFLFALYKGACFSEL